MDFFVLLRDRKAVFLVSFAVLLALAVYLDHRDRDDTPRYMNFLERNFLWTYLCCAVYIAVLACILNIFWPIKGAWADREVLFWAFLSGLPVTAKFIATGHNGQAPKHAALELGHITGLLAVLEASSTRDFPTLVYAPLIAAGVCWFLLDYHRATGGKVGPIVSIIFLMFSILILFQNSPAPGTTTDPEVLESIRPTYLPILLFLLYTPVLFLLDFFKRPGRILNINKK